jgi:hypothetical protein
MGSKVVDAFVETTIGADMLQFEATRAEIAAYPDIAQELIDADISKNSIHLPFTDPRKEAREAIVGLPRLDKEQWQTSKFYRKGMKYEPDITEARLQVYSDWYDAKAKRQDIIERRDAGFIEGTGGFLAGIAGAAVDPVNLISFAVAPEAKLAVKVGTAAVENIAAELVTQLTTMDIRSEAGIAPTIEERLLNVAFAGIIGSAFGAGAHVFHTRALARAERKGISPARAAKSERVPVLVKDAEGQPTSVKIEESRPTVNNLTEKTISDLTVRQKADILARLDEGMTLLARGPDVPEMSPHSPNFTSDLDTIEPFERVIRDALSGDPATTKAILDVIDLNDVVVREALLPDRPTVDAADPEALTKAAADINTMPDLERNAVGQDQDISLVDIDTPPDVPLLQGRTLFEVADNESDNFETGLEKAVDLINGDGCR